MRRGQCALIVDAPTAIGAAVAAGLAADGWSLVLHYSDDEAGAEQLAIRLEEQDAQVATIGGALSSPQTADALLSQVEDRWGPALVLVNNAGGLAEGAGGGRGGFRRDREASHLTQSVCALRRAIGPMRAAGFGRVVNVTTSTGAQDGGPLPTLLELSNLVAPALAPHGVTVNTVAAGLIRSGTRWRPQHGALGAVPARRPGTPEEVAACIRFLAGPHASYVTGQVLFVDGGTAAAAARRREGAALAS